MGSCLMSRLRVWKSAWVLRVLRLLTAHGIFQRQHGSYGHTPSSLLLRSDHPMTMRALAQMMGMPFTWGSLTEFKHSS